MNAVRFENSFQKLKSYCESENYKGWDPYDGLNSKVFQSISRFKSSRFFRLAWIQAFKRNPINLRRLFLIEKGINPKGLALFLNGYCNLYHMDPKEEYLSRIRSLVDLILEHNSPGYSGACWGYNFDWQAKAFYQPAQTPTVVASTFIGFGLYNAYDILQDEDILESANSISSFILNDLNRTYDNQGDFSFSYSPLDQSQVYNATLLGSKMLAKTYDYTGDPILLSEAKKSVEFCMKHQKADGSWTYSTLPHHQWVDNFHTGYNLECISEYQMYSGDFNYQNQLEKGFEYYINTFFLPDGKCKYYNNTLYPIDIHAPAQFIITLNRLKLLQKYKIQAERVLTWTIDHMQHRKGYFFFQKQRLITSRIPYIRWAQGWMFYALSDYLLHMKNPK